MNTPPVADYQQTIRVQASPDALFDALTTAVRSDRLVDPDRGIRRRRR